MTRNEQLKVQIIVYLDAISNQQLWSSKLLEATGPHRDGHAILTLIALIHPFVFFVVPLIVWLDLD